jgi:type III restriction enzyme
VIVNRLTDTADARFRLFSRHQLFPQVLNIVREYADTRIEWNGVDKRELALVKYAQPLVELLTAAIVPDDARGEPPILPVIDRFNPWGSSADVTFSTQRECHPTMKSHVDQVVLDTQQWERSVTFRLESSEVVVFYVRNDHLDFSIPYEFMGVSHLFFPDFIVRLTNAVNLVLEVKGMVNEQQKAKFEAAKRWCKAVSNWGKAGRWEFHVSKDPETVKMELKHWASQTTPEKNANYMPTEVTTKPLPKVFVSHNAEDKPFVRRMIKDLESADVSVWFDEREINLGSSIIDSINDALADSDYLLLIHSKFGASSNWVKAEVAAALYRQISNEGMVVLSAVLDDTPLPPLLRDRLYVDFQKSYDSAIKRLVTFFKNEASRAGGTNFPPLEQSVDVPDDCPRRLAELTKRDLRKRVQTTKLPRDKLALIWNDVLETRLDDELPGKALEYCIQELIIRAEGAGQMSILLEYLCEDVRGI